LATFKTDQFDSNNNPVKKDKDGNPVKDKDGKVLDKDGKPIDSPTTLPVDKDGKPLEMKDGNLTKAGMAAAVADSGGATQKDPDGNWIVSMKDGKPEPFILHYKDDKGVSLATDQQPVDANDSSKGTQETRQFFDNAGSVVTPHNFSYVIIQACIAILILVGFESVTSMGEEAKDPKRHIPWAVLLSLTIQGAICYLFEYFAANFCLNPGYKMTQAAASSAPIGDMMKIVGAWLFGSPNAGWWFMFIQAITVLLALVGTTLACMNTGARVTYAMGRDDEVPSHFGLLHGKNLTPHRAIWTLATLSVFVGIFACSMYLCSPAAADPSASLTDAQKASIWYPSALLPSATMATKLPNSLLIVTLVSNFGTFLLYMLTCVVAIVAFREHHTFSGFKHMFIPLFGVVANLLCMLFYLIGPLGLVPGMTPAEPYLALFIAAIWGVYGLFYFNRASKKRGKTAFLTPEHKAAMIGAGPTS
jgi:amino acid transporter